MPQEKPRIRILSRVPDDYDDVTMSVISLNSSSLARIIMEMSMLPTIAQSFQGLRAITTNSCHATLAFYTDEVWMDLIDSDHRPDNFDEQDDRMWEGYWYRLPDEYEIEAEVVRIDIPLVTMHVDHVYWQAYQHHTGKSLRTSDATIEELKDWHVELLRAESAGRHAYELRPDPSLPRKQDRSISIDGGI